MEYKGDYGRMQINVSDVRQVALNTLGPDLFSTEDFGALDDLVSKLRGDQGEGIRSSRWTLSRRSATS